MQNSEARYKDFGLDVTIRFEGYVLPVLVAVCSNFLA
jgi:hypothetical protein